MPICIRKICYLLALAGLLIVLGGLTACGNAQSTGTGDAAPTESLTATPTRIAPPLAEITALPPWRVPPTLVPAVTVAITATPHICPMMPTNSVGGNGGATCDHASALGQTQSPPYYLTVQVTDGAPELRWGRASSGLHYDPYRADWPVGEWRRLTSVTRPTSAEVDSAAFYSWRDASAQSGGTYCYGARTVNYRGGISELVVSKPITVP